MINMKLAIVFLNKIEFLEDILAAFLEIGVRVFCQFSSAHRTAMIDALTLDVRVDS